MDWQQDFVTADNTNEGIFLIKIRTVPFFVKIFFHSFYIHKTVL